MGKSTQVDSRLTAPQTDFLRPAYERFKKTEKERSSGAAKGIFHFVSKFGTFHYAADTVKLYQLEDLAQNVESNF